MKIIITILLFSFISLTLSGCDTINNVDQNNNSKTNISRTSLNSSINNNSNTKKEIELSYFSTPLKSGVANRITNIKITANKINGYTLKNGETFSFNELIGPCTAEEGYQKAEIYVNKEIKYALGGRKLPS